MNIFIQKIFAENHRVNRELDEDYRIFGPEPDSEKNYKIDGGYKAVVEDLSSPDTILIITDGHLSDIEERPF